MAMRPGCTIWFEPVSAAKAVRALGVLPLLDFVSPNAAELLALAHGIARRQRPSAGPLPDLLDAASLADAPDARQQIAQLLPALSLVLQVVGSSFEHGSPATCLPV